MKCLSKVQYTITEIYNGLGAGLTMLDDVSVPDACLPSQVVQLALPLHVNLNFLILSLYEFNNFVCKSNSFII